MEEFERRQARRDQIAEKVAKLKQLPRPPALIRGGDSVFLAQSSVYPTYVRQVRTARQEQDITSRNARFITKQLNGAYNLHHANDQLTSTSDFGTAVVNTNNNNNNFGSIGNNNNINLSSFGHHNSHHQKNDSSTDHNNNNNNNNAASAAAPNSNTASSMARLQLRERQRQWLVYVAVARFLHIPLQAAKILAMVKLRKLFGPVIRRARMRIKKRRRMAWLLIASQWKMTRPTVPVLKAKCRFFSFWPDAALQELIDSHMVPASDTFGNVLVMGGSGTSGGASSSASVSYHANHNSSHHRHRRSTVITTTTGERRSSSSPTKSRIGSPTSHGRSPSPPTLIPSKKNNNSATRTTKSPASMLLLDASFSSSSAAPPSNNNNNHNNHVISSSSAPPSCSPLAVDVYISDNIGDLAIYSAKQLHPWSAVEVTQTRLIRGTKRENGETINFNNKNNNNHCDEPTSTAGHVLLGDLSVAAQVSAMTTKNNEFNGTFSPSTSSSFIDPQSSPTTTTAAPASSAFRFSLELRVVGTGTTFYWRIPHAAVLDAFRTKLTQRQQDDAVRAARCDYLELTAPLDHSRLQQALSQWEDIQWPNQFIAKLQTILKPEFYAKGTTLFRDGDSLSKQKFILIVTGAVNLYTRPPQQQQQQQSQVVIPQAPPKNANNTNVSSPRSNRLLSQQQQQDATLVSMATNPLSGAVENFNSFQQQIQQQLLMAASTSIRMPSAAAAAAAHAVAGNNALMSSSGQFFMNNNNSNNNNLILIDRAGPWTILDLENGLVCGSKLREHTAVCATDVEAWTCDFSALRRILVVEHASFALAARASFHRFVASSMLFLSAGPAQQQQMRHEMISSCSATGGNFYFRGAAAASMISLARALHATPLFRFFPLQFLIELCCGTLTHPILNISSSSSSSHHSHNASSTLLSSSGRGGPPTIGVTNHVVASSSSSPSSNSFAASLPRPIPHCTLPGDSLSQCLTSGSGSDAPSFAVIVKGTIVVQLTKETDKPIVIPTSSSSSFLSSSNNRPGTVSVGRKSATSSSTISSSVTLSRKDAVAVIKDEIEFENDPTKFLPSFVPSPSLLGCAFALVSQNRSSNNNAFSGVRASSITTTLASANRGKSSVCASDEGIVYWWEVPAELIKKGLFALAMMSIVNNYTNSPSAGANNHHHHSSNVVKNNNSAQEGGAKSTSTGKVKTSSNNSTNHNNTSSSSSSSTGISISTIAEVAALYYGQYRNHQSGPTTNNNNNMNRSASSVPLPSANNNNNNIPTLSHAKQQQIQRNLTQNLQLITQQSNEIAENILWEQLVKMCQEQSSAGGKFGGLLI